MLQKPLEIAIVGGGIGGLVAAHALGQVGHRVTAYERTPVLREIGAGITLMSNAVWVLDRLGLGDALRGAGAILETGDLCDQRGRILMHTPAGELGRSLGAPCVVLTRSALQRLLVDALPAGVLQLGQALETVSWLGGRPGFKCTNGERREVDLVIGADGLRSQVRAVLWSTHPPAYAGYSCWRGLTQAVHPNLARGHAFECWGPGRRFGVVPLADDQLYWFATINTPAGGADQDVHATLRLAFRGWRPPIEALIEATTPATIIRTDIVDRPPLRRWSRGAVTLLGDAAHPMTPNLGQGAGQAIEDAWALRLALDANGNTETALGCYEALRKGRTSRITAGARRLGWIGQQPLAPLCAIRNWCMRQVPQAQINAMYLDAARPPWTH